MGLGLINERVVRTLSGILDHRRFTGVFVVVIGSTALLATILHGFEVVIWAAAYLLLGALPDTKSAMLYSLSAITTYGHANLCLEPHWQLMGALEALNTIDGSARRTRGGRWFLSPIAIGWVVFALVFGRAILAMFVHSTLPEHHLSADSKDVVKLGIAVIATMSALVLSLLIASAKSAFDTRSNQLVQVSADIILLDRVLARCGPETKDARSLLQRSVAATVERFWPTDGDRPVAIDPDASPVEALYDKI
jgi:quinol-cytochrome oxidoreductase complex cytochrome b subunit